MTASKLASTMGANFFGGQSIGVPYRAYPQIGKVRSYSTVAMRWRRATVRSLKRRAKGRAGNGIGFSPGRKARPYTDKKSPPKKCSSAPRRCAEKNSNLAQDRHAVTGERDANRATIAASFHAKPRFGVE